MPERVYERQHAGDIVACVTEDPVGRFAHDIRIENAESSVDRHYGEKPSSSLSESQTAADALVAQHFPDHRCTAACGEWLLRYPGTFRPRLDIPQQPD